MRFLQVNWWWSSYSHHYYYYYWPVLVILISLSCLNLVSYAEDSSSSGGYGTPGSSTAYGAPGGASFSEQMSQIKAAKQAGLQSMLHFFQQKKKFLAGWLQMLNKKLAVKAETVQTKSNAMLHGLNQFSDMFNSGNDGLGFGSYGSYGGVDVKKGPQLPYGAPAAHGGGGGYHDGGGGDGGGHGTQLGYGAPPPSPDKGGGGYHNGGDGGGGGGGHGTQLGYGAPPPPIQGGGGGGGYHNGGGLQKPVYGPPLPPPQQHHPHNPLHPLPPLIQPAFAPIPVHPNEQLLFNGNLGGGHQRGFGFTAPGFTGNDWNK